MQSVNPATNEVLKEFQTLNFESAYARAIETKKAQPSWRDTPIVGRTPYAKNLAAVLRKNAAHYARLMTLEMGKPITQAKAEVEKCAWLCEYFSAHAGKFLAPEEIKTDAKKSYIRFDPLGTVLAIMPWNFPFWQIIRAAVPALLAGNGVLLKHASNVPQCALAVEEAFNEAGFPSKIFQTLLIDGPTASRLIETDAVQAVSLTGSTQAGANVAQIAGKNLKKCVLELGGSDPFIICRDADLDKACSEGFTARMQNAGQSCIAAKRFMIHSSRITDFEKKMLELFKGIVTGDPLNEKTTLGPLANRSFAQQLQDQVDRSVKMGGRILVGGAHNGPFFEPTLISDVTREMPVWKEEIFGPVMAFMPFENEEDMIRAVNNSEYGLGGSLWSEDIARAEKIAAQIESGFVSINGMTKSDPRLPFGGIKRSGFGKELGAYGIKEFVNCKTVVVN